MPALLFPDFSATKCVVVIRVCSENSYPEYQINNKHGIPLVDQNRLPQCVCNLKNILSELATRKTFNIKHDNLKPLSIFNLDYGTSTIERYHRLFLVNKLYRDIEAQAQVCKNINWTNTILFIN